MSVDINIDLNSKAAHGKIEALETRLKAVNDSLDLDFDIDDDLKDSIDKITQELKEIDIDVDYSDLERAAALKAMLEGDIDTKLDINTDEVLGKYRNDLDPPDGGGIDHDGQARKFSDQGPSARFERFTNRLDNIINQPRTSGGEWGSNIDYDSFLERQRSKSLGPVSSPVDSARLRRMQERMRNVEFGDGSRMVNNGAYWDRSMIPDDGSDKRGGSTGLNARRRGSLIGRFKKKLRSLVPSMNTFYTLFAAILPLLLAMGTQLAGVAASMGSVAIAGGSILALGLVGHGEDMASSWEKAQEQLADLKQEMFNVFQPTMQTFAPIQARFFDIMPEKLNTVASSMEGLTAYSDTLFASFDGLTDFIASFFDVMIGNESTISQLTMRFGEIIGSNILSFFGWLVQEAYNSQEILIQLGAAFVSTLGAIYQFSMIIAQVVSGFGVLGQVFNWVGKLLNNKIIVAVIAFIGALAATIWAVTTLVGVTTALVSVWAGGLIATIISSTKLLAGYIFRILASVTANYALAASIANVVAFATMGIGALLGLAAAAAAVNGMNARMGVDTSGIGGGGIPTSGGAMSGGAGSGTTQNIVNEGDTYNMEVNGNVDNPTEQGLRDLIRTEGSVSESRQPPDLSDN